MASDGIYQVQVYFQNFLDEDGCAIEIKIVRGYILHPEINGYYRIYKVSEDRDIPFLLVRRVCFETQLEYATVGGVVVEVISYSNSTGIRKPSSREKIGILFNETDVDSSMSDDSNFSKEEVSTLDIYHLVRRKFQSGMNLPESGNTSILFQNLYSEVQREIPGFIDKHSLITFRELCLGVLNFH